MIGIVDAVLLVVVVSFALLGLRSGIVHETATLIGLGLGLPVAGRYSERIGLLLLPWLHTRGMANLVVFLLILFATWILVLLVGSLAREILQAIHLGWLDNLGGAALGALKGLFLVEIIILIVMALPIESLHASIMHSWLASRLARLAPEIVDLIPPVLRYWKPL